MKTLIRVTIFGMLLASACYADSIAVGIAEKTLLEAKGPPESKATAGNRIFYRWKDLQATVIEGKVTQVQARDPATEKRNTGNTNKTPSNRPPVTIRPANNATASGGISRTNPGATTLPAPVDDAVTANRKKEARREQLVTEIATYQNVMDTFDKQNAFKKKEAIFWITREQYEAAKAERDKRQQERDELAR